MSKRSRHLAVRALPGLAAELRAYKRTVVAYWRAKCFKAETTAARNYTWNRYQRERAKAPSEFRASYQSECVRRICRESRATLLGRICRGTVRMLHT